MTAAIIKTVDSISLGTVPARYMALEAFGLCCPAAGAEGYAPALERVRASAAGLGRFTLAQVAYVAGDRGSNPAGLHRYHTQILINRGEIIPLTAWAAGHRLYTLR